MPCYSPMLAVRNSDGSVVFSKALAKSFLFGSVCKGSLQLPCGQCIGCRLERSRVWAMRCVHEASLHDSSYFLTLTYDDDHLDPKLSLDFSDLRKFLHRLRYYIPGFRYYACGEYGDVTSRPHFHVLLFGAFLKDRCKFSGDLYTSPLLERVWGKGFAPFGGVTFESAAYVARYCLKKVTGERALDHYRRIDPCTGEVYYIEPEAARMSLRPAIGRRWFELYKKDRLAHDYVVFNGVRCKPPRYYDNLLEAEDQGRFDEIKSRRIGYAERRAGDNTIDRLKVKEAVKRSQIKSLKREL